MTSSAKDIEGALAPAQTVLVVSHMRPDGDALGSTLAFARHLERLGKSVHTWNEDGMPEKFRYLPGSERITPPPSEPRAFDAVVAVDTSTRDRLGSCLDAIFHAPLWINIDHHISNEGYGDLNLIDPSAPAAGQILFEYFESLGVALDEIMAGNLFAAISTDTGSFQYRGTDGRTFHAAARLVEAGVNVSALSQKMYDSHPRRHWNLLRHTLNTAQFLCQDRLAVFAVSRAEMAAMGALPEDTEGLITHLRAVEGVVVAAFYEELEDGMIRISVRSKNPSVNACEICQQFGGGGHPLAAGVRLRGSLEAVMEKFNATLCHEIERGN